MEYLLNIGKNSLHCKLIENYSAFNTATFFFMIFWLFENYSRYHSFLGLVSLFNGISLFMDYLMTKQSLKNTSGTI